MCQRKLTDCQNSDLPAAFPVTPTPETFAIGLALPEPGGILGLLASIAVLLGLDRTRRRKE